MQPPSPSIPARSPSLSRRGLLCVLVDALAAVSLAACGATTTTSPTGTATDASAVNSSAGVNQTRTTTPATAAVSATKAAAAPGSSGSVDFWSLYAGSAAFPKVTALIQQKHQGLRVNFVQINAAADLVTKLVAAVTGGNPPAGVYITAPFFRDTARFLAPLDSFIKRDATLIDVDDFLPIGLQASTINGKVYGLPMEVAVRGWWFNRPSLAAKGVPLPVGPSAPTKPTLSELADMGRKLTAPGAHPMYGLFVDRTWWDILIYVFGFGGKFLDDQQTTCLLDSPQAVAGMQQAFDFVVKDQLGPPTGAVFKHAQDNDIAMALGNAALAQNFRTLPNGADWDTGPVVMGPAAPMTYAFVHHGGIVQGTSNPEAAWTVLYEFTGKDAEPFWMDANGWPTARQSYLNLWIKEGVAPPTTRQNVLAWAKAAPLVTFPVGYNGNIDPAIKKIVNQAIAGQLSVKDMAAQAAQQVTALLQKP
jgi:ABC-type glycerol-3-phosphate transport system substrate-binding protein